MKLPKFLSPTKLRSAFPTASQILSPRSANSTPSNSLTNPSIAARGSSQMPFRSSAAPSPRFRSRKSSSEIVEESPESLDELPIGSCSSSSVVIHRSLLVELEQAFKQFDTNGDGKISAAELGAILSSLGENTADEEATLIIKQLDADGDGYIDLQEFIDSNVEALDTTGGITSADELRGAFHIFDLNRNGFISAEELHSVLASLGDEQSTLEDCSRMIKSFDRNGDGFVDFEEFKSMMASPSYQLRA